MEEMQKVSNSDIIEIQDVTINDRLEIIEERMRKKYLSLILPSDKPFP